MDVDKTSRPRTRAKNATSHPGEIVLQAGGKGRTKAEKAAEDKLLRDAQAEKEQAKKKGIARCHAPNRFGTVNMEDNVNIKRS